MQKSRIIGAVENVFAGFKLSSFCNFATKLFNPKSDDDSDQDVIYEYEGFNPIIMQDF